MFLTEHHAVGRCGVSVRTAMRRRVKAAALSDLEQRRTRLFLIVVW